MSKDSKKNTAPPRIVAPEPKPWRRAPLRLKALAQWAEEAVLEAAQNADLEDGEAKAAAALDIVCRKVDDAISPPNPIAEIASDLAIAGARLVLAAIIEDAFKRLRAKGRA